MSSITQGPSITGLFYIVFALLGLWLVQPASGAWQEISDYTDCGSINFVTEKILVDFNSDTYWLNISVLGRFNREVVSSNPLTEKASNTPTRRKCFGRKLIEF